MPRRWPSNRIRSRYAAAGRSDRSAACATAANERAAVVLERCVASPSRPTGTPRHEHARPGRHARPESDPIPARRWQPAGQNASRTCSPSGPRTSSRIAGLANRPAAARPHVSLRPRCGAMPARSRACTCVQWRRAERSAQMWFDNYLCSERDVGFQVVASAARSSGAA